MLNSDHARPGTARYLCAEGSERLMRSRLGEQTYIQTLLYGEKLKIDDVVVSFHPAGHVLGSADMGRPDSRRAPVVSGDYKLKPDAPFAGALIRNRRMPILSNDRIDAR